MLPKLAGIRQPGQRKAGTQTGGGGGGGGGSSNAVDITITDAGNYYVSGDVEDALQEAGAATAARAKTADLSSNANAKGASTVGIEDAGALITATTVEGALAELATSIGARAKTADLSSNANAKGASTVGIEDAGALITATTVEGALGELATSIAARAKTADLSSTANGKGASTVGIEDAGNLITATTVEGALAELAGAPKLAPSTLGDASVSIAVGTASEFTMPVATMTANRTITLSTTGAVAGEVLRIIRRDTTAFTLAVVNGGVGGGTMYTSPVSVARMSDYQFDGTNWFLAGHARLA